MVKLPARITLVPLASVNWLKEYYPRHSLDDCVKIPRMIDALKVSSQFGEKDARAHLLGNSGADAPYAVKAPVKKDFDWLLLDGARRLHAYHRVGRKLFPIEKDTGIPETKFFFVATQRNIGHGSGLSPQELCEAVQRLTDEGWKEREVLEAFQVRPDSYTRMAAPRRVTRSVKGSPVRQHVGFLKAPFAGLDKIRERQLALDLQAPVAAKSVEQVLNEMSSFLVAGVFDGGEWNESLGEIGAMIGAVLKGGKGRDAA